MRPQSAILASAKEMYSIGAIQRANAKKEFRNLLLPLTIDHAIGSSSLYGSLYGGQRQKIRDTSDLPALPVITKHLVTTQHKQLLTSPEPPALIQHTTGTTGSSLSIYRSRAEVDFIQLFFSQLIDRTDPQPVPLTMHLYDQYHGASLEIPSRQFPIRVGLTDDILITEARRALTHKYDIANTDQYVTTLIGLVPYIKTFTQYLVEQKFDFSQSKVRVICPLCTIITPRWRALLRSLWGASVVDRYSLSEIFGGATYCLECCNYHFDPQVIAEVLDPFSEKPIESGVGVLVLTSLFPFVQLQPMIRYRTDDLVEIADDSCSPDLSVKFCGRLCNATWIELHGNKVLPITPVTLYEILDSYPDVAFSQRFIDLRLLSDHCAAGSAKFHASTSFENNLPTLVISIELRYSPWLYPERTSLLRKNIANELMARCSPFKRLIDSREIALRIEFTPPCSDAPFALKV